MRSLGVAACLEDRGVSLTFIEDTAPRMFGHMTIRSFTPKFRHGYIMI